MNAVERLLAHGEEVVLLFDEMLDSRADPDPVQADCIVRRLQDWHQLYTPFADISVELSAAPPRYRSVLNEQRLRLMELWRSETALGQEMVPATKSAQDASFSKFCGWRLFGSA